MDSYAELITRNTTPVATPDDFDLDKPDKQPTHYFGITHLHEGSPEDLLNRSPPPIAWTQSHSWSLGRCGRWD